MKLKSLVTNRAHPEGSIAEGYIATECLTFCSRYFENVETQFNRPRRNYEIIDNTTKFLFSSGGGFMGKVVNITLDDISIAQAHRYVLLHSDAISSYRR
jgi:hypothetical protein